MNTTVEVRRVAGVGDLPHGIVSRQNYPHDKRENVRVVRGHNFRTNRYSFDWHFADGRWAQLDTSMDASYYGHWINPHKRAIVGYAEGDVVITVCATDDAFVTEVTDLEEWHRGQTEARFANGMAIGIDCGIKERRTLCDKFQSVGLGKYVH